MSPFCSGLLYSPPAELEGLQVYDSPQGLTNLGAVRFVQDERHCKTQFNWGLGFKIDEAVGFTVYSSLK